LALLRIGPDGLILVEALIVSVLIALLAWRRVGLAAGIPAMLIVSQLRWLARHAWVFVLAGPIVFVGCYVGICELCVKARLI